jgi:hypothetical protein
MLLPIFHGWRGWPREAVIYAEWLMYSAQASKLPFSDSVFGLGVLLLFLGVLTALKWSRVGALLHLLGLACLAYWNVSDTPSIRDSLQNSLNAALFLLSGTLVAAGFIAQGQCSRAT